MGLWLAERLRARAPEPRATLTSEQSAAQTARRINAGRRRCGECSLVSNVGGIGNHQKTTGHTGGTELNPAPAMPTGY